MYSIGSILPTTLFLVKTSITSARLLLQRKLYVTVKVQNVTSAEFSRVSVTASVEKQQTKLSERYLVATAATARVSPWHPVTQGKYCFGAKRVVFLIKENPLPFRFKVSFLYKSKSRYYNSFQFELTFNYLIIFFTEVILFYEIVLRIHEFLFLSHLLR